MKQKKLPKSSIGESVPMEDAKDPYADMTLHNFAIITTLVVMTFDSHNVIH